MVQNLADFMAQLSCQAQEIADMQAQTHQYNDIDMYSDAIYEVVAEDEHDIPEPSERCGTRRHHKCCYKLYSPIEGRISIIWAQLEFPDHIARRHSGHIKDFRRRREHCGMGNGLSPLRSEI